MVATIDELCVDIGFCPACFRNVILSIRRHSVIEVYRFIATTEDGLRDNGPSIRMGEDGSILFHAGINPCHIANRVINLGVTWPAQVGSVGARQLLVYRIHTRFTALAVGNTRDNRPRHVLQEYLALGGILRANFHTVTRISTDIPVAVPQFAVGSLGY